MNHKIKDERPIRLALNDYRKKLEEIAKQSIPDKPDRGLYLILFNRTLDTGKLYDMNLIEYINWWNEYRQRERNFPSEPE